MACIRFSLGLGDEVVRVVPVGQHVRGVLIVHADVLVAEHPGEEVVDLSGDVQYEADSAEKEDESAQPEKPSDHAKFHFLLATSLPTLTQFFKVGSIPLRALQREKGFNF